MAGEKLPTIMETDSRANNTAREPVPFFYFSAISKNTSCLHLHQFLKISLSSSVLEGLAASSKAFMASTCGG